MLGNSWNDSSSTSNKTSVLFPLEDFAAQILQNVYLEIIQMNNFYNLNVLLLERKEKSKDIIETLPYRKSGITSTILNVFTDLQQFSDN